MNQNNRNSYLASGFQAVDETTRQEVYANCLNYIDTLPYFTAIKQQSYTQLKLDRAKAVLDLGCGLGHDVYRMAKLVPQTSHLPRPDQVLYAVFRMDFPA